jgi:hypothetical protein
VAALRTRSPAPLSCGFLFAQLLRGKENSFGRTKPNSPYFSKALSARTGGVHASLLQNRVFGRKTRRDWNRPGLDGQMIISPSSDGSVREGNCLGIDSDSVLGLLAALVMGVVSGSGSAGVGLSQKGGLPSCHGLLHSGSRPSARAGGAAKCCASQRWICELDLLLLKRNRLSHALSYMILAASRAGDRAGLERGEAR